MKTLTHKQREQIKMYIKNGIDISPLLDGYSIRGENLEHAIIHNFNRTHDDLSNVNLSYATIGQEGKVTVLSNNIMRNCEFVGTKFLGIVFMRRCDCKGSNFNMAEMQNVEYQYTDFRQCTFCEAVLRLGVAYGYKAIIDENLFQDLAKYWNLKLVLRDKEVFNEELEQRTKGDKNE